MPPLPLLLLLSAASVRSAWSSVPWSSVGSVGSVGRRRRRSSVGSVVVVVVDRCSVVSGRVRIPSWWRSSCRRCRCRRSRPPRSPGRRSPRSDRRRAGACCRAAVPVGVAVVGCLIMRVGILVHALLLRSEYRVEDRVGVVDLEAVSQPWRRSPPGCCPKPPSGWPAGARRRGCRAPGWADGAALVRGPGRATALRWEPRLRRLPTGASRLGRDCPQLGLSLERSSRCSDCCRIASAWAISESVARPARRAARRRSVGLGLASARWRRACRFGVVDHLDSAARSAASTIAASRCGRCRVASGGGCGGGLLRFTRWTLEANRRSVQPPARSGPASTSSGGSSRSVAGAGTLTTSPRPSRSAPIAWASIPSSRPTPTMRPRPRTSRDAVERREPLAQFGAQLPHLPQQRRVVDDVEHRQRRRGRDRAAGEGRAVVAGLEHVGRGRRR